jgi:hypothetical protein
MGSCGCGEPSGLVRLSGPNGTWYGLEVYTGCRDCGTDPTLAIYTMVEGEDYVWDEWERVPEIVFGEHGTWFLPLLDQQKLVAAFEEWLGADDDLDGDDGYDPPGAVHDFVHEGEVGLVMDATIRASLTDEESTDGA